MSTLPADQVLGTKEETGIPQGPALQLLRPRQEDLKLRLAWMQRDCLSLPPINSRLSFRVTSESFPEPCVLLSSQSVCKSEKGVQLLGNSRNLRF